jgi:hypothetical protein
MKKVFILVVAVLIGSTTQTFSQHNQDVIVKPGKKHRYYNSQEIRFVENGVLYKVATNGLFNFSPLRRRGNHHYGRRNHNVKHYPGSSGGVQYSYGRPNYRPRITTDRFGNIRSVGSTYITYKRNGKVKSIGDVAMQYYRGKLTQVGGVKLIYNHHGKIKDTLGSINHCVNTNWHDDWYNTYDAIYDDSRYDRKRKKNNKK